MIRQLLNDEAGFIVSAELVLVATILVLGLVVGLSQVQYAVVEELNDVAHAIGSLNQSYGFTGFHAHKSAANGGGWKSYTRGAEFIDKVDACDNNCDAIHCAAPVAEQ